MFHGINLLTNRNWLCSINRSDANVITQLIVHVIPFVRRKMNFQLTFLNLFQFLVMEYSME